ncbi:hypothetical protein A2U01_0073191, partial [Trifolium medium]|nr:hypothetical protein [Trifolium medium]
VDTREALGLLHALIMDSRSMVGVHGLQA